jgi:hypothetical protein
MLRLPFPSQETLQYLFKYLCLVCSPVGDTAEDKLEHIRLSGGAGTGDETIVLTPPPPRLYFIFFIDSGAGMKIIKMPAPLCCR